MHMPVYKKTYTSYSRQRKRRGNKERKRTRDARTKYARTARPERRTPCRRSKSNNVYRRTVSPPTGVPGTGCPAAEAKPTFPTRARTGPPHRIPWRNGDDDDDDDDKIPLEISTSATVSLLHTYYAIYNI